MTTATDKKTADQDGMLADTPPPVEAGITASRHPELGLKNLPKVPAYSGTTEAEMVNHPAHYGGDTTYETRKVIRAWELGFNTGNVVKYISRAGRKPGTSYVEDLRKALFYLQDEIDSASSDL